MSRNVLLRVPATLAYRQLTCRTVAAVCKLSLDQAGAGRSAAARRFADEFMSAVGEAFNNVVIHAYANTGEGDIELELFWDAEQVVVEMRDSGTQFDFDAVPPLDLDAPHEGGMGVYIIRSFVDQAEYRAGSPNVLVLTKRAVSADSETRPSRGRQRRAASG
jgi:serine/threonine-protein kinase RsbW